MRRPNPLRRLPGNAACQKTRFSPLFLGKFRPLRKPGSRFWGFLLIFLISWGEMIFFPPRFYFYFLFFSPFLSFLFAPLSLPPRRMLPAARPIPPCPDEALHPNILLRPARNGAKSLHFGVFPCSHTAQREKYFAPSPPPNPSRSHRVCFGVRGDLGEEKAAFTPKTPLTGRGGRRHCFGALRGHPDIPIRPPPPPRVPLTECACFF